MIKSILNSTSQASKVFSFVFLCFFLGSCERNETVSITTEVSKASKRANDRDRLNEELNWVQLECGLWQNKNGEIGWQELQCFGTEGMGTTIDYLLSIEDSTGKKKDISLVIDSTTFELLSPAFAKDSNHVYWYYAMACGGRLQILEDADPQTFQVIGDCYAKDKNLVYYDRTGRFEQADLSSFQSMKDINCYAMDKNGVYRGNEIITNLELKQAEAKEAIRMLKGKQRSDN